MLEISEPLDNDCLFVRSFLPLVDMASWEVRGKGDSDITGTHTSKHRVQTELKFPKIKTLCFLPYTSLIVGLIKRLLIGCLVSMVPTNSF